MKKNVLIIGAGGVAQVAAFKAAMHNDVLGDIHIASRTLAKCEGIIAGILDKKALKRPGVLAAHQLDALDVAATVALITQTRSQIVINAGSAFLNMSVLKACVETGAAYIDTAIHEEPGKICETPPWYGNYEWKHREACERKGVTAILGAGFDPGVTSIMATWVRKHKLDGIRLIDVLDCNGGDNGKPFATNFNPEINIREVTAPARHWENGAWIETPAMTHKYEFDFPEVGKKNMYLMYHEELESLSTHFPEIERARFWMTFGDAYIQHAKVLENVGMTRIDPVMHNGQEIIPIQFLKTLLPDPGGLAEETKGKACIGDIATGQAKDGSGEKTYYIYNICDHEECFAEVGSQAVSYTTGVPAMIGAAQVLKGNWKQPGVWNMEQLDPDDFMDMLNTQGLPWQVHELDGPVDF